MASNIAVHDLAKMCLRGEYTFDDLDGLEKMLDYREKVDELVGTLVVVMGLKPFPPPHEWDPTT